MTMVGRIANPARSNLVPVGTVLLLTLISVTPLGFGEIASFALPLLPFTAIHFWAFREERAVPIPLVFLTGLLIDALTYGPLGYWSLLYLGGAACTAIFTELLQVQSGLMHWTAFMIVNAAICVWAWTIATIYFGHAIEYRPMLVAGALSGLIYPILAGILGLLDRWSAPPRVLNLERGA